MLPLYRWFAGAVGVLMSSGALPQAAATPPVIDESKLPEWVKRQARSPYKVIIESSAARTRAPVAGPGSGSAGVPKEVSAARLAKKAMAAAAATPVATPATVEADEPAAAAAPPAATPEVMTPGSELGDTAGPPSAAHMPIPASPPDTSAAASIQTDPAPRQLATAAPTAAAAAAAAKTPLAAATLPVPPPEPSPLTLLNRVEPAFPPDLVNDRLNQADVLVSFTVKADGEVVNVSVASTSDPRLNRSVLRAVRAWRYAPINAPREHSVRFAFTTL